MIQSYLNSVYVGYICLSLVLLVLFLSEYQSADTVSGTHTHQSADTVSGTLTHQSADTVSGTHTHQFADTVSGTLTH